jgi:gamma-butyrobetaine dioxygenase
MNPVLRDVPVAWLRANCPCQACLDPVSGQRLVSITDLPADPALTKVMSSGDEVRVTFAPDGHHATFSYSWLTQALLPEPDPRTEDAKHLWRAADFPDGPPVAAWDQYLADELLREACLEALLTDGFMLLDGVPQVPGTVLEVAASMGFVRETNYGRLFDVRVSAEPANLAFSALAIGPHTDNPYRDPVPTVQLLHCLANAAAGGESALVDGFAAARLLRAAKPAAFAILSSTPVTFCYSDGATELRATKPMIGVDPSGRIREIRFNNRSIQPLRLGQRLPGELADAQHANGHGAPRLDEAGLARPALQATRQEASQVAAFYDAYRDFAAILAKPELTLTFRLNPGECVVFDNTRILHARTAFTRSGGRHLQGCYADLDGVESSLAILCRTQPEPAA